MTFPLDPSKCIQFVREFSSLQEQHRKVVLAVLLPMSSPISTPSILEGEVTAKVSVFQQIEYKTEDCELRMEQVGQKLAMQVIQESCN